MSDSKSSPPSDTRFALADAQRNLATHGHDFVLGYAGAPDLQLRVVIEPLGESVQRGVSTLSYRRTVLTLQAQKQIAKVSALCHINRDDGRMVSNEVQDLFVLSHNAQALPKYATVGDSGQFFESHAHTHDDQTSGEVVTQVTWSLEAYAEGRALWCVNVQPQVTGGIESSEAYVIEPNGAIVGAAIRTWARPPQDIDVPASPVRADGKQLIQWSSV